MKITAKVTEDDIKRGVRCASRRCPIALAIKRSRPAGFKRASIVVLGSEASMVNPRSGKSIHTGLSCRVSTFIRRFDECKKVKPFKFTLNFR